MTTQSARTTAEISAWRREMETALLSGLLNFCSRDSELLDDVLTIFPLDLWRDERCRKTVKVLATFAERTEASSLHLVESKLLTEFPDALSWLAEVYVCWNGHVGPTSVRLAAEKMRAEHTKSLVAIALTEAANIAKDPAYDVVSLEDALRNCVGILENAGLDDFESADPLADYFHSLEAGPKPLISTPWSGLNRALAGGVSRGELIVLGARPSVGKTAFAVNWFWHTAACGGNALLFSLEMTRDELFNRIVAKLAGIDSRLLRGRIESEIMNRLQEVRARMTGKRMHIEDSGLLTPADIRRICKARSRREGPLDLVVIDYLQLVTPNGKFGNREQEVSSISRSFKLLAKDLNVPVLLLAQLNRENEKNNREPKLSDLRESGSIEQDADTVLFLHQDRNLCERCRKRMLPEPLTALVAKGRNTGVGYTRLAYNKSTQNISDPDKEYLSQMDILQRGYALTE